MKLTSREWVFLLLMVALLGSAGYVLKRGEDRRQALQVEMRTMEKALEDLASATAGVDDLNRKVNALQQAVDFFSSKLPAQREIDSILAEVTKRAEANSLQTTTFRPLKGEYFASYSEQPIEMTITGDFNGFYAFLLELERLPRLTRLMQMHLSRINDRDGEMTAKVTLSIFFEPDRNTLAANH